MNTAITAAAASRPPHAAPVGRPRQFPAASRVWIDRVTEFAVLDRLRARPGPMLVITTGMSGVGKTAFAVAWLRAQRPACPESACPESSSPELLCPDGELYGELYVDLGGVPGQPPPAPAQVLAAWVRALGVPTEDIPHDLGALVALLRTMAESHTLRILIDNAQSADQVRPLLPASPRSIAVVTSRHRLPELALDGCAHLALEGLPADDGAALLAALLADVVPHHTAYTAANTATLTALAGHCHGLPLALAIAGGYLTLRHHHGPDDLLAHLDAHPHEVLDLGLGQHTIGTVLTMTYDELDPDLREVLRLCATHPSPEFTPAPLAAAARRPERLTERALAQLVDTHHLDEIGPHRYRIHDLVRTHTRALRDEDPDERDEAERRMLAWYLRRVAAADRTVNPSPPRFGTVFADLDQTTVATMFGSAADALTWFTTERATLLALPRLATDRGWHTLAAQLAEALWNLVRLAGTAAELLDTQRCGAHAAAVCAAPVLEILCWRRAAYAETNLGRHTAAIATATTAVKRARQTRPEAGDESDLAYALGTALEERARAYLNAVDPHSAQKDLTESFGIQHTLANPERGLAIRHRLLGRILLHPRAADFPEAIAQFRTAARYAHAVGDEILHARVRIDLAAALLRVNDPRDAQTALDELTQVKSVVQDYGATTYRVDWLITAGNTHAQLGNPAKARTHYTEALTLLNATGQDTTADTTRHTTRRTEIQDLLAALGPVGVAPPAGELAGTVTQPDTSAGTSSDTPGSADQS